MVSREKKSNGSGIVDRSSRLAQLEGTGKIEAFFNKISSRTDLQDNRPAKPANALVLGRARHQAIF